MSSLWQRWIADIPNLDNDDWSNVWDFPFKQLVSLYNRLIQIKIVHRAYFTPYWVHKMDPSFSQCCWRWSHSPGNYIHIFWSCPAIVQFWVSVLQIIQSGSGVVVPSSPCACLLGLVEELDSTTAARISFFFFMLGNPSHSPEKKPTPLTVAFWKQLVNSTLPLYKDTYCDRECKKKNSKSIVTMAIRRLNIDNASYSLINRSLFFSCSKTTVLIFEENVKMLGSLGFCRARFL